MAGEMTNIEIKDFLTVSGVEINDFVVLSLSGGTSAKMAVGVFKTALTASIKPSIRKGVWWVGETNLGVTAEGKNPEFRKTSLGIEWKYTKESIWKLLVPVNDILFKFDELTNEQRDLITLKFSDLTDEEIAELQSPAKDMIAQLETTDQAVKEAENARVEAEALRAEAETSRIEAETARMEAELERDMAEEMRMSVENARIENETSRVSSENERKEAEKTRVLEENARIEREKNRVSQENERVEAENERISSETYRVNEFSRLKSESESATNSARDTAEHPTYVGKDNYVYKWNKAAQTYDKTDVYVRGEAFSIKRVYTSIDAMYSDTSTPFKEGDFCLINTGSVEDPENAQLFVRTSVGGWDFLVDMSGAVGFTGKVPQLFIGTVDVGSGKDSAAVTITPDGTDADGNPKYRLNYIIPCLAYEDLTEEQVAELQRPANEMIAKLTETDDAIKESEQMRATAENERIAAENERASSEKVRSEAEETRNREENSRQENERIRQENENARQETDASRKEDYSEVREGAVEATANANLAAQQARNLPKIQNGTWWLYDIEQGIYVDTGYSVNADYQLTKEGVESVLTGNIESHWHDRYVDKEEGKQLSTEDFTTQEKEKLVLLENYDDTLINEAIDQLQRDLNEWDWEEF